MNLSSEKEKKISLVECIETGWISSEAPFVENSEEDLSKKVNQKIWSFMLKLQLHLI